VTALIKDFRLSFIWATTFLELPASTPAPFAEHAGYERLFSAVRKGKSDSFATPWPRENPHVHRFWANYLSVSDPSGIDGAAAWAKAVPLRGTKRLFAATMPNFPGTIRCEHYFYPFGAALVVTFHGSGSLTGEQWTDHAVSTQTAKLSVTFEDQPPKAMPLKALADETLNRVQAAYFTAEQRTGGEPFTIMTVVRGEGVDAGIELKEAAAGDGFDSPHRWLFGVSTLRKNWRTANLKESSFDDCLLTIQHLSSPGDVVFASTRGRAIWIPSSFGSPSVDAGGNPITSQSCYHRNQLFAALQTDSLCSLVQALSGRIAKSKTLPPRLDEFGRIAAATLAEMDQGDRTRTYRSMSVSRQIADRGIRKQLVLLQKRYGL
jgi:hypothetical protein